MSTQTINPTFIIADEEKSKFNLRPIEGYLATLPLETVEFFAEWSKECLVTAVAELSKRAKANETNEAQD